MSTTNKQGTIATSWMSKPGTGNVVRPARRQVRSLLGRAVRSTIDRLEERRMLVANVAPVANPGGAYTVAEGSSITVTGVASTDIDGTIAAYAWDLNYNAGNGFHRSLGGKAFTFDAADGNATRTIALRVTDNNGATHVASTTINITDVAPTVTLTGPSSVNEGATYTLGWSSTDVGQDTITGYAINWGDNTAPTTHAANAASATHVYAADGAYTITLTATDEDGPHATTKAITVNNVAPTITASLNHTTIDEGESVRVTYGAANRAGTIDQWIVDWGDDTTNVRPGTSTTSTHTYADNGVYTVTVTALEPDGSTTDQTLSITVNNTDPTLALAGLPDESPEGTALTVTQNAADVAADTVSYAWTLTKNGVSIDTSTSSGSYTFTPDDNGEYTVSLTVTDDDGGHTTVAKTVTVTNVAPIGTVTGIAPNPFVEGGTMNLSVGVSDVGSADTFTYKWVVEKNGLPWSLPLGTADTNGTFAFTPTDNGSYVVSVLVKDDDNGQHIASGATLTVVNATPTASIGRTDAIASPKEGDALAFVANVADAGSADTFTYHWGVTRGGVAFALPGGVATTASTFGFTPTDNATYSVTLSVTDDDGALVNAGAMNVVVANAAPTATITGPGAAPVEGSAISFSVNAQDAGSEDSLSYLWTVTKGGANYDVTALAHTSATFAFTPRDQGNYVVSVRVTDDDAGTVTASTNTISVANAAPVVSVSDAPADSFEGETIDFHGTATDAGADDTLAYAWSVTRGNQAFNLAPGTVTNLADFSFIPTDNGSYVATLVVTDGDGDAISRSSRAFTVSNVAPLGTVSGEPVGHVNEGATLSLTVAPTDAGAEDTFTYEWHVERNGHLVSLPNGLGNTSSSFSYVTQDDGTYIVGVTISDDDGGQYNAGSTQIAVDNVAPTANVSGGAAGNEGVAQNFTVAPADAGTDDTFTYAWSVTKNGNAYTLPAGVATSNATFSFTPNDNGSYVTTCVVTDDDAGTVTASSNAFTVANVAPTGSVAAPSGGFEGSSLSFTATPADAGTADTFAYAWTVTRNGSNYVLPGGVATTNASLTFTPNDNGSYVATVAITDDDGGTTSVASSAVIVANVNPVPTITGTPGSPVTEGTPITLGNSVTDAGSVDTVASYLWSVKKDGVNYTLPNGTATNASSFTFTPRDNGSYVATLTVTDNDGGTGTVSSTAINVLNANPGVTITGTPIAPITEGTVVSLTSVVTDAGADDTHDYLWTVKRNGQAITLAGVDMTTPSLSFAAPDNGTFVVKLEVTDDDGAAGVINSPSFTVTNVAPSATISGAANGNEGTAQSLTANVTDPGSFDTFTFAWTVTKGGLAYPLPNGTVTNAANLNFTPNDNGTYLATCVVTDDDGGTISVSTSAITIANVAPVGTISGTPIGSVNEGSGISLGLSASDVGTADTLSYAWRVTLNGNPYTLPNGTNTTSSTFSFTPRNEGSFVAIATITDDDGGVTDVSTNAVTAVNVAPVLGISGPATGQEGDTLTYTHTFSDVGTEDTENAASYFWSLSKNGVHVNADATTSTYTFNPTDNGAYLLSFTASDSSGGSTTTTKSITVSNVAPTATISGPTSGIEGSTLSFTKTVADAGSDDTHTYLWSVTKDGSAYGTTATTATYAFTPNDNGAYVVKLVVTDDDDGVVIATRGVAVSNVDPTASISGPTSGTEGSTLSYTSTLADAGTADTLTRLWSVTKNGSAFGPTATTSGFSFTPNDNGAYVVQLVVTDDDGGTVTATRSVNVANVDPTATINGPTTGDEGAALAFTSTVADAGAADTVDAATVLWTVTKDGTLLNGVTGTTQSGFSFTPRDNGNYVVSLALSDDDGGAVIATKTVLVSNVDPTVNIAGPSTGTEGVTRSYTSTVTDAGADDTFTYAWSVTKDGQAYGPVGTNASYSFVPTDNGTYVASLLVTDNDGGSKTVTKTITIANAAPVAVMGAQPAGSVAQGDEADYTVEATDAGANDTLGYAWQVTRNGAPYVLPNDVATTGASFTFLPTQAGAYTVTVTVSDNDRATATIVKNLSVTNIAPTIESISGPTGELDKGTPLSYSALASDAGNDVLSYSWTITRGGSVVKSGTGGTVAYTPTVAGDYVVQLTVSDGTDRVIDSSTTFTAVNHSPVISSLDGARNVNEGAALHFTAAATDADNDTLTRAWSVSRNGTVVGTGVESNFDFTTGDDGAYTVTLTVSDGTATDVETANFTVANVAPTATVDAVSGAMEGVPLTVTGHAVDRDALTTAWNVRLAGSDVNLATGNGTSITFTPTNPGQYVANFSVNDGQANAFASTAFTVANSLPTATVLAPVLQGVAGWDQAFSLEGINAYSGDTLSVDWVWGDGTQTTGAAANAVQTRRFATAGTYTVTANLHDEDGGTTPITRTFVVNDYGMQPDPSGEGQVLVVLGTAGDDAISFTRMSNGKVRAVRNNVNLGSAFNPTRIFATGELGNDSIAASADVTAPAYFSGGAGKDTLKGGSGDDVLMGKKGIDSLSGNAGRDILIGGVDSDTLNGGEGEDILIGGTFASDGNVPELTAISAEWSNTARPFADRIARLRNGAGGLAAYFATGRIIGDTRADALTGGSANDWLFKDAGLGVDSVLDAGASDRLDNVTAA